jgi:aminotransferase
LAERLRPSGIRAIFDRALELERAGHSIVHMEIGRPHLDSPAEAKRAAVAALEAGAVHYTANRGIPELRAALGAARGYDPETEVVVTAGGSEAVAAAMMALLEPGDEVLVPTPAWPHYAAHAALAGCRAVEVPCRPEDGFEPDPERLQAAADERARMLVVSSPSNPTGAVVGEDTLEGLAALCAERDLIALSDEIYARFTYGGAGHVSIATLPGMRERTVVADSFSKAYSMTGWRVGYAAAPAELAARINAVHQYLSVCAPSFAQAGALAALEHGGPFVERMVAEYDERRRALLDGVDGLVGLREPRGAFYAFPDVGDGTAVARGVLDDAGVATVPGEVFGAGFERHLRLSYAIGPDELAEGVARIRDYLSGAGLG